MQQVIGDFQDLSLFFSPSYRFGAPSRNRRSAPRIVYISKSSSKVSLCASDRLKIQEGKYNWARGILKAHQNWIASLYSYPSAPHTRPKSRERTKLKGSRDKREVTIATLLWLCSTGFPPVPNSVFGAFHFLSFDSQKVEYIYKDYLYRRAIIFRFARRRWRLATIPGRYSAVVIYLLPKRERKTQINFWTKKGNWRNFWWGE